MSQKVINLFGGPGTGKSETASGVFNRLKQLRVRSEYVQEFAKDLTWEGNSMGLACQDYIFGTQFYRMFKLIGQVEFIVTDSPLMLTPIYNADGNVSLNALAYARHNEFDNFNVFLQRVKPYDPVGRGQDEEGAKVLDGQIKNGLISHNIPFIEVPADEYAVQFIVEHVLVKSGIAPAHFIKYNL